MGERLCTHLCRAAICASTIGFICLHSSVEGEGERKGKGEGREREGGGEGREREWERGREKEE